MRRTIGTILALGVVATTMAFGAPSPAHADYYDDNSVSVVVDVEATSREGNVFGYRRTTEHYTHAGSEFLDTPGDFALLTYTEGCAGNYAYAGQAFVDERRDDGAVRVSLLMWTWDGQCSYDSRHGAWSQQYHWIAANESLTIDMFLHSSGGSTRATATFTNRWAPQVFEFVSHAELDVVPDEENDGPAEGEDADGEGHDDSTPLIEVTLPTLPNPWEGLVPPPVLPPANPPICCIDF